MRKEELRFDSRDQKTKLYAVRFIPDGEVKCILQIVHGMAEHMGRYEHVAEYFTKFGILVTGDDHLGHGQSVPEDGVYGYFCEQDPATTVVRDVHRLKKITQEEYPKVPYFIWGHSMGSFILRNYMFRYGTGITGSIICGTGTKPALLVKMGLLVTALEGMFRGQKHVSTLLNTMCFGSTKNIAPDHVHDWLSYDRANIEKYDADSKSGFIFTVNGFKTLLTLIDRQNNKKNIEKMPKDLPVLIISGEDDIVGDCGKGVRAVAEEYKNIKMTDTKCILYPHMKHEIMNEADKEKVFEDIISFIKEKAGLHSLL